MGIHFLHRQTPETFAKGHSLVNWPAPQHGEGSGVAGRTQLKSLLVAGQLGH